MRGVTKGPGQEASEATGWGGRGLRELGGQDRKEQNWGLVNAEQEVTGSPGTS